MSRVEPRASARSEGRGTFCPSPRDKERRGPGGGRQVAATRAAQLVDRSPGLQSTTQHLHLCLEDAPTHLPHSGGPRFPSLRSATQRSALLRRTALTPGASPSPSPRSSARSPPAPARRRRRRTRRCNRRPILHHQHTHILRPAPLASSFAGPARARPLPSPDLSRPIVSTCHCHPTIRTCLNNRAACRVICMVAVVLVARRTCLFRAGDGVSERLAFARARVRRRPSALAWEGGNAGDYHTTTRPSTSTSYLLNIYKLPT